MDRSGWLLTRIAIGVVLGIAAGVAGAETGRTTTGAVLVVGILPAATVLYYFSVWGAGWLPVYINNTTSFLTTPATVTVSSVAVGLLTVALIGGQTRRS